MRTGKPVDAGRPGAAELLRAGATLGVGLGETVSRVIAAINFGAVGRVHMVTLTGGVDGYLQTLLSSKGESTAESEVTTATIIPSPIVASTPQLAVAMKAESTIQQGLKQARGVGQALVGWALRPWTRRSCRRDTWATPTSAGCAMSVRSATFSASSSTPAAR